MPCHPITEAERAALDLVLDQTIHALLILSTQPSLGCTDLWEHIDQHLSKAVIPSDAHRAWLALTPFDMPLLIMSAAERLVARGLLERRMSGNPYESGIWMHTYALRQAPAAPAATGKAAS